MSGIFGPDSALGSLESNYTNIVGEIAKEIGAKTILNQKWLTDILHNQYAFPEAHRTIIWRYIFRLPMNDDLYTTYASQPRHPKIRTLPNRLPIQFSAISNRLMRILSALTYWHPPLSQCDWLPALVFPFVQIL